MLAEFRAIENGAVFWLLFGTLIVVGVVLIVRRAVRDDRKG
jgi:hypothetical protein